MFTLHPGKEKALMWRVVPRRPGPRPGWPHGRDEPYGLALAPLPRLDTALPGRRRPGNPRLGLRCRAGQRGRGVAGSAPSPFFLLSPQLRPRLSYPASCLPESPAAATVPSRPNDSSSDLVQELSQDTHRLPSPPPRSRFRRSLAELEEMGEARGKTAHPHWWAL